MARIQTANGQPAVYNSSTITLADTQAAALQVDANGNLKIVDASFSFSAITTSTTTTVKSGAGVLHSLNITNVGATGNSITVYDNTAGSGTQIAVLNPPVTGTFIFDIAFATGLTVVTAGTTPPVVTVAYR